MCTIARRLIPQITDVIVYKGHEKNPIFGPYGDKIEKRIQMFEALNPYRICSGKKPWRVTSVSGESLVETLKGGNPEEMLLVIPAGESSRLDKVFSIAETEFLQESFFSKGGRGYFTCGSSYWASSKRIYHDICEILPENRAPIIKISNLSLFDGIAEGPLCPYPSNQYKIGFYSDAVRVTSGKEECSIYLSGGGTFIPHKKTTQKIRVLAKYLHSELERVGKKKEDFAKWQNAAIMVSINEGAAILSMFHPYYGPNDIDVDLYEKTFPNSGTNWKIVKEALSPVDLRMRFVWDMISKLEGMEFDT